MYRTFDLDLFPGPNRLFGSCLPISSDDSTAASSHASGYYDTPIGITVKKYRKIRQADFLKAMYRKKCAESEALRRKLKTAKSASETKKDRVIERETKKHVSQRWRWLSKSMGGRSAAGASLAL